MFFSSNQASATVDTLLGMRDGTEEVKEESGSTLLQTLGKAGTQLDMSRDDFGLGPMPPQEEMDNGR